MGELCDDLLDFSWRHRSDKLNLPTRIAAIRARFGERPADSIRPADIAAWLEDLSVEPATEAR